MTTALMTRLATIRNVIIHASYGSLVELMHSVRLWITAILAVVLKITLAIPGYSVSEVQLVSLLLCQFISDSFFNFVVYSLDFVG